MSVQELIAKLPDDRALNELVRQLRQLPKPEANDVIENMLRDEAAQIRHSALKLCQRLTPEKDVLIKFINIGLERRDVSEIRFWLLAIAKGIGYKRIVTHLHNLNAETPDQVIYAWYQLVPIIKREAPEQLVALAQLSDAIDARVANEPDKLRSFWDRTKASVPL